MSYDFLKNLKEYKTLKYFGPNDVSTSWMIDEFLFFFKNSNFNFKLKYEIDKWENDNFMIHYYFYNINLLYIDIITKKIIFKDKGFESSVYSKITKVFEELGFKSKKNNEALLSYIN